MCTNTFLELFHRYGYIYKPLAGGSWLSANEQWKLPNSEILKAIACAHPKYLIGCRAGKATQFAVLDIDHQSRYHNKKALDKILGILDLAGLSKSSLYRSSYSEGWHLYIFFGEPIHSGELRRLLGELFSLNDIRVSKGQLEIFPNPGQADSIGLGLRLPLQPGFAWLDKRTLEVDFERHELSPTKALELFVDSLEADANSYSSFKQLKDYIAILRARKENALSLGTQCSAAKVVPIARSRAITQGEFDEFVSSVFQQLPPGIIVDNWYKGRIYHLNGLMGPSQRAEAIECLSHYLFYGDPSRELPPLGYGCEQERQWAIERFLHLRNNGQSKDINHQSSDALAQVERAAQWRPSDKTAQTRYSSKRPASWVRENANRKTNARKRIKDALESIKKCQRSFSTVELETAAGCSRRTLYAHSDIWRKDYEDALKDYDDLADGFFASCTDEYNGVEGAASSQSMPPSTRFSKNMPPERLAARRIVYELAMRTAREQSKLRKKAVAVSKSVEQEWQERVESTLQSIPADVSLEKLKALLVVLTSFVSLAPTEEQQTWIQEHIQRIRSYLSCFRLMSAPERPPP